MVDSDPSEPVQRWLTQMRKGLLELSILAVLSREDGYGYLIVQRLKQIQELTMNEGSVYPILQRLHREGCLSTYRMPSKTGPPRRWFKLTDIGRERYTALVERWRILGAGVDQLLEHGCPETQDHD